MPRTTYRVTDHLGASVVIHNPERAEHLSRAGFRVTAVTV